MERNRFTTEHDPANKIMPGVIEGTGHALITDLFREKLMLPATSVATTETHLLVIRCCNRLEELNLQLIQRLPRLNKKKILKPNKLRMTLFFYDKIQFVLCKLDLVYYLDITAKALQVHQWLFDNLQ